MQLAKIRLPSHEIIGWQPLLLAAAFTATLVVASFVWNESRVPAASAVEITSSSVNRVTCTTDGKAFFEGRTDTSFANRLSRIALTNGEKTVTLNCIVTLSAKS